MNKTSWLMILSVCGGVVLPAAAAPTVIPWDATRGQYYLNMPMTTAYSPDIYQGPDFVNENQDKWCVVGVYDGNTDNATWSFVLPGGHAFKDVTISVSVFIAESWGTVDWVGSHYSDFGTAPDSLTNFGSMLSANAIGAGSYAGTLTGVNQPTIYFRHQITNAIVGWLSALSLERVQITSPGATVTGTVDPECFAGNKAMLNAKFVLQPTAGGDNITQTAALDSAGHFTLTVPWGTYNITARVPGWLSTTLPDVALSAATDPKNLTFTLKCGDVNGDNAVNFEDFAGLQNNYGKSGVSGANPLAAAATGGCGALGMALLTCLGLAALAMNWRKEG